MSTIHRAVERAGGLASVTDLAKQWDISKQRVGVLSRHASFPEPVGTVNGRPVWLASEAREWRDKQTNARSKS